MNKCVSLKMNRMKTKLSIFMCIIACMSCQHAGEMQATKDDEGTLILRNDDSTYEYTPYEYDWSADTDWMVTIKLKPQADANSVVTNDPKIKALEVKYGVKMT